jgi:Mg-chelatase subunit ChlD
MLPILLLLCAVALNIARFRLLNTELKIATDVAAHSAGRALSYYQDADKAIAFGQKMARLNAVGNKPLELSPEQFVFGRSTRATPESRYTFAGMNIDAVRSKQQLPNSVAVNSSGSYPLRLVAIGGRTSAELREMSIATQGDRDVVLVLDRSGSMLTYKDEEGLVAVLDTLKKKNLITSKEHSNAVKSNSFSLNVIKCLSGDMQEYAADAMLSAIKAPRHSRWAQLQKGVSAFFSVVDKTDPIELVSMVTFSSSATLNVTLRDLYDPLKAIISTIAPSGNTAIGSGMIAAADELFKSNRSRPYATKTIVVLTDGINNSGPDPLKVAKDLVSKYPVTIYTITLSKGAEISTMQTIAQIGGGMHYHSDDGEGLDEIFRTIANNLPTLLTQ